jgi:ATP-dependent RNA helicase HelY
MAVNLVQVMGRVAARELLESSFAQFQADRAVVGLARQVRRNHEAMAGYGESMTCHLGDFREYAGLRRSLSERESRLAKESSASKRAAAAASLEELKVGDVIRVPSGRRAGLAVVVDPRGNGGPDGDARPVIVTADRQIKRLAAAELTAPVAALARVKLPRAFNARSPQSRRDLVSNLRNLRLDERAGQPGRSRSAAADDHEIARLRAAIRQHPCHGCDEREDHARWAERYDRLRRDTDALEQRMSGRTGTLGRMFDRVCDVLTGLGYLEGDRVTDAGRSLARLYSESDLVVAESLRSGAWDSLTPPELASVVSALVYEARRDDDPAPRLPSGAVRNALVDLSWLRDRLHSEEAAAGLDLLRETDPGFAWAAWRWASGHPLDAVLRDGTMAPGDFVRWVKQLVDLLDQVSIAAPESSPVRRTARQAVDALRRGVVAYSVVG